MLPLLSREEINNLVNLTINEKAVSWDDSLLKGLTSGVAKSFSFLGNKIKGGLQKSKMNSLVMQWGAEYAKAIEEYKQSTENTSVDSEESQDNIDVTGKKEINDEFIKSFNSIYSLINGLNKPSSEFRKHFSNKTMINLTSLKQSLDKLLDSVNFDDDVFNSYFKDITELYAADDSVIEAFSNLLFIIRTINEDIREDSDLYQRLQSELKLQKFVPNESKWPELKQSMSNSVLNTLGTLSKYLEPIKKDIDSKVNDNYSFINEAFSLPTKIEDLYDKEELDKLSKIKDIKLKVFKKINTKAMSVIEYEANYIIDNANDKNKAELKRIWDIGKKNVENYFQNVVDTKKVNQAIKNDEIPADVKTDIDNQNIVVDMADKMGLLPLDPIKATFKDKLFYAFNMTAIGSAGTISDAYFLVSPTSEFSEEDSNGNKYFYFNIFGQYKFNDKSQSIERINFFDELTKNNKMDKNFKNKQNSYYMVMPMMKVNSGIKADRLFYIYSNSGKGFYNKQIIDDYTTIVDKIKESNKQQWVKIGNAFKYSVNARFSVDMDNIKRFPGLDQKDLTSEAGITLAKKNHKVLIDNLKDK